jgi:predicted ThiF/HesA family dinucleotide-utilizing enzyme
MDVGEVIKAIGVTASLLWALARIIDIVRVWRGGSPELRVIKEQLVNDNDKIHSLLERILERLDGE